MVGVVIHATDAAHLLQKWEFCLCHFCPDVVYVVGADAPLESAVLSGATYITSAADLPVGPSLVVLAPSNGVNLQGDESLADFAHPSDTVYWFGSDANHLEAELFAERAPDHKVYIPTDTIDQMYSFVAWAVVGWDRRLKG